MNRYKAEFEFVGYCIVASLAILGLIVLLLGLGQGLGLGPECLQNIVVTVDPQYSETEEEQKEFCVVYPTSVCDAVCASLVNKGW